MPEFEGLATAKVNINGTYFSTKKVTKIVDGKELVEYLPTEFEAEIEKCSYFKSFQSGDMFTVEARVTKTSDPDNHPVGSLRTWQQGRKMEDIFASEVKKFLLTAMGIDYKDEEAVKRNSPGLPKLMGAACDERAQALKGKKFAVTMHRKTTKVNKKDIDQAIFSLPKAGA